MTSITDMYNELDLEEEEKERERFNQRCRDWQFQRNRLDFEAAFEEYLNIPRKQGE